MPRFKAVINLGQTGHPNGCKLLWTHLQYDYTMMLLGLKMNDPNNSTQRLITMIIEVSGRQCRRYTLPSQH